MNLPFQLEVGIHTSILIAESLDGDSTAVTRQNAGSAANCVNAGWPGKPEPPEVGGVKAPGGTVLADVIIVFGNFVEMRLSQGAPKTGNDVKAQIASPAIYCRTRLPVIAEPPPLNWP
jgi:hypothetical protein